MTTMSSPPDEELDRLIADYICTPGMHMELSHLQQLVMLTNTDSLFKILKNKSAESGYTAFHCAATRNHPKTIKCLLNSIALEGRFNVLEIRNMKGQTAFHRACIAGWTEPIRQMLDCLPSPEQQMELIQIRDNDGCVGKDRAVQCFRAEVALFLQTAIRQLKERMDKKETLPEEHVKQAVVDSIWVLELISDQQQVEYLKLKTEQDESLLKGTMLSLEDMKGKKKQVQELKQGVTNSSTAIAEHATKISEMEDDEDAVAMKKSQLKDRLDKLDKRSSQRLNDLDLLNSQLNMFEQMKLQTLKIVELTKTVSEQEKKLNDFQVSQLTTNEEVTAEVEVLRTANYRHEGNISEMAGTVKQLEYNQLPAAGTSSNQPYENGSHLVICSPVSETQQQQ